MNRTRLAATMATAALAAAGLGAGPAITACALSPGTRRKA
jgi:hypothetical protein